MESDEKVIHEISKSFTRIPQAEFWKMIEEKWVKRLEQCIRVSSKKMVAIRMIPNVKMTICNRFQYSFSFLTFSHPVFGRGRLTFVYKIVHIPVCISHTEVIERSLDVS